jgi:hypothetical protein
VVVTATPVGADAGVVPVATPVSSAPVVVAAVTATTVITATVTAVTATTVTTTVVVVTSVIPTLTVPAVTTTAVEFRACNDEFAAIKFGLSLLLNLTLQYHEQQKDVGHFAKAI